MAALQYVPADESGWLVMTTGSSVLLLGSGATVERISGLWEALHSEANVQTLLDELTRGGISTTPSFALLIATGEFENSSAEVQVIVRGPVTVQVHREGGIERVTGAGTTTWTELKVTSVRGVEAAPDDASEHTSYSGRGLPLIAGAARALKVSVGSTTTSSSSPSAPSSQVEPVAPAPAADPVGTSPFVAEPVAVTPVAAEPVVSDGGAVVSDIDDATITMEALAEATIMESRPESTSTTASTAEQAEEPSSASSVAQPILVPRPEPAGSGESGYDYLFGQTIARTVEDAAVRVSEDDDEPDDQSDESSKKVVEGDHDGKTTVGIDPAAKRAARRARAEKAAASRSAAPTMAIDFSTGSTELLDQAILIGRAPSVSKVSGASLPRLVTITGPDQDISRNHAQVAFEGGTVVITDLHSRNGTMINLPGRAPQQLRAGEPTPVIPGTLVDLGAGVTFTVREL